MHSLEKQATVFIFDFTPSGVMVQSTLFFLIYFFSRDKGKRIISDNAG
jgi:hypothetical protein